MKTVLIKGRVYSQSKRDTNFLPLATVFLKGTQIYTLTDSLGYYSIDITSEISKRRKTILVCKIVGFSVQEITINKNNLIVDFALETTPACSYLDAKNSIEIKKLDTIRNKKRLKHEFNYISDNKSVVKKWTIDKYNIKLYRGLGLFGPAYYYYMLDKSKFPSRLFFKARKTYVSFQKLNNCEVSFNKSSETKYQFDICKHSPEPVKTRLNPTLVKSIEVIRIDSTSVKTIFLDSIQKTTFINGWNQSTVLSPGSPRIKYLIKVQQGYIRTFNSDGYFLFEQPENAKYEFPDKNFFTKLFDK